MWEWKDCNGVIRTFKPNSNTKRCPICGQFFKKEEKGCIIVPPMEIRKQYKKLSQNLIVHPDEWKLFCDNIENDKELAEKFTKHKTPKKKEFTKEELKKMNAFRDACYFYKFYEEFKKPYGLKCKQRGSSISITYYVYADKMDIDYRGKKGLFDGFYTRQIVANVYNKMHEILEDDKKDEYSVSETIHSVIQEAKKMAGKI